MGTPPIFTGAGDSGNSRLIKPGQYKKSEQIFETLGAVDELSAFISLGLAEDLSPMESEILTKINADLSTLMAVLAGNKNHDRYFSQKTIWVEGVIASITKETKVPNGFVTPSGDRKFACFNVLRTICRRAEREVVRYYLSNPDEKNTDVLMYLNRLSSLFFGLMIQ